MATTTSITTTYAGESAGEYISAALLSGATIENGGVTVKPNVKFKEVIKKLSTNDIVKDATCDFDATSTITLTERILQPEFQQVNLQLCKKDFISTGKLFYGVFCTPQLTSSFSDYLIAHVAAKVADRTERSLWSGDTATNGQFNGFTKLVADDADLPSGQEIAGTTVTSANVITELGKIVDAIPSTLYGEEDMYIYVSQNIARAYVRALGGFGTSGLGANGTNNMGTQWWNNGSLSFDGVKLFVANGLADNDAIATAEV